MSFAPQTLTALAHLWVSNDGVNLGIVGDTRHTATGTSYHLGRDQLIVGAYSAKLARDVAGLSNAASAIDLGELHGSLHNLQKFSVWLVYQIRANPRAYRDIREVIYSPDGSTVLRWDNELHALRTGGDGTGQGDNTHLWHTHISFYRDSEFRDKRDLFAPYFTAVVTPPDTATEEPMGLALHLAATTDNTPLDAFGTAKIKGAHSIVRVRDSLFLTPLTDGTDLGVVQRGELLEPIDSRAGDRKSVVVFNHQGESHVAMFIDVVFTPLPKPPVVDTAAIAKAARGLALEQAHDAAIKGAGDAIDELPR